MYVFNSGRPASGRASSFRLAILRRFYLIALVAALALPAHAWAQAVCASPGSSGGGTISGIVNTYFQGNGNLAAGATTLTLGTLDSRGAATTLAVGDLLLVMQMQDGQINSTNSSAYGDGTGSGSGTTSVGSAGLHEFVTVTAAVSGTTGDTITFAPALTNTYSQIAASTTSGQKRYQVIRVPQYTAATASGITAPGWGLGAGATGETGGVAAVDVRDTLTLGSATVEGQANRAFFLGGKGFRGAAGDGSSANNGSNADWVTLASSTSPPTAPAYLAHGGKGEGIAGTPRFFAVKDQWGFQTTNAVTSATNLVQIDYGNSGRYGAGIEGYPNGSHARGAPGNAGGGGTDGRNPDQSNDENAGGGGGGSFAAGGLGGRPWNAPLVDSDGRGGGGYAGTLAFNRVFLGGGGGSGGTNNSTADPAAYTNQAMACTQAALCSSGAAGGGIVIIRARSVVGSGTIDVRGAHAYNVQNDAAGGGGGGGAVVVYSVDGGSATITASGGDGGNAWAGNQSGAGNRHGPGGGGGGGFVAYSPQGMSVNATLDGGTPGLTTNGTDTYSSSGNIGGLSTFQSPNTPGTIPGALCSPDLQLTKSDGVSSITPSQALTYTLTVKNNASAPTIGTITVVDVMPATLVYAGLPTFVTGNFTCTYNIGPPQSFSCASSTAIAANGTDTIAIPVTVSPTATPGSITNQAQVGGGGDPNKPTPTIGTTQTCTANDTPAGCAVDVDALQSPLLSVTKSDGTTSLLAGGATTYSLIVSNTGGAATTGTIQLVDVLPTGLVYSGAATFASGIFSCTFAAPNFTCTSATPIAIGGSSTITIPVSVSATAPGAVTNLAQVGGGGDPTKTILPTPATTGACPVPDPPATTSSDPASGCAGDTDAVKHVNLTMTKDDGVPFVLVGGSTTYTYVVTNGGDAASVGTIYFRDELPAGLSWPATLVGGGVNAADWACVRVSATSATCTSATPIASGANSKFTLLVSAAGVTNGSQYLNKSRIAGGADADLLPGPLTPANVTACISNNNPAGCALDLDTAAQAIIRLAKTHTGASFNPGATVPFTLAITNSGGLPSGGAGTITVIDPLPTNLTYTGAATFTSGVFNCAVATNVVTCTNTAPIAAGATSNITFSAIVSATATNAIVNPAKVGSSGGFDPSNDTPPTAGTAAACTGTNVPTVGCATDPVALNADLQITKTDGAVTYAPGASVTYTITATNAGPSGVVGAVVSDTIPVALTGVTWTATYTGGGSGPAAGSGNINATVTLPPTATAIFTVTGTTSASASGDLVNTATITASTGIVDTNPANNSATDTDTAAALVDLAITKTDGVTTVVPGNSITYTIVVTNSGPSNAVGATVADTFPAAFSGTWTCVGSLGGTCTASGSGNINDTVNVPVGASVAYTVTGTVSAGSTGTLSNTSNVVPPAGTNDSNPTNNSATDTDTLTPVANLAIVKTDGVTTANAGGTVTYTITASNLGPSNAPGAVVADALPASIGSATWTCAGTAGGTCTASGSGNINDTVNLPAGASVVYTVTAQISAAATGNVVNTATITPPPGVTDPVPGNNSSTDTDSITQSADLSITKTDGVTTATAGGSVTYTIVASNAGPSNAVGATVTDTFPASLTATWTCVGASGGTCAASGSGNINATVNLPAGASVTYTVIANIGATATGTLSNTATVTAPAGVTDPTPGNNSATDTDTLSASADLSITKTDGVTTATAGNTVTYTITASNAGPSDVTGATIADILPPGITGATWTCAGIGGGTCTATGNGNINDTVNLPSGAAVVYTVTAPIRSNATGTLSNTATVTTPAGVTDPTPGNNSATDTDTLNATADTSITKSDGSPTYTPGGTAVYTIVATNAGPSDVTGATVSDALPAGITAATWTCAASAGSSCAASGTGAINDATVHLVKNGTATYTLTLTIPSGFTGNLVNTANVANPGGVIDPNPANNSATDTDTRSASADLSMTKTDNSGTYTPGGNAVYTIVANNNGPSDVTGATVSDPLPTGITTATWICSATSGSSCAASGSGAINDAAVNLKSGGSATYTLTLAIPSSFSASLVNTATVANPNGVSDPDPTNNSATDTDTLSALADIALTKTVDNATPNVGDDVTFTITAQNNGPSDATGVAATDALPSGLTYVSSVPAAGTTYDSGTGVWTIGALNNGASVTLTITATVGQAGALTNTVAVTASDQTDPDTSNNSAGASINGNPSADVQVNKIVDDTAPNVGNSVTFTISAKNAGPNDATGVQITDLLPAGLTYVSSTASQGTYTSATGIWNIGGILNGDTQTLTITATVTQAGTILNTATKTAENENDPVSTNNQSGATLNGQQADVQVVKTVDNADPNVGDTVTFTVTTTNLGPSSATGVQVTDALPAGLSLVTATPSSGTYNTATGIWNIGNLDASGAGAVVTLTITATVNQPGTITNTATKTAEDQTDPNTTNNTSSSSLSGAPSADVAVTKSGPAAVTAGNTVVYTVTIVNNGPSDAASVSVTDTTPSGLTFVSNAGDCTTAYPCSLGTLVNGETRTITSTYSVPSNYTAPTTITNTATATSTTPDPNTANNSGTTSANLGVAIANVSIVKTGTTAVTVNGQITYLLLISNAGPSSADGSTFSDTLPAGLTFVSATCGNATGAAACGPVNQSGGTVSGTVNTLAPDGSVTITIVATAPNAATIVTNTATVAPPTGTTDSDPTDNTSSTDTTVTAAPAMADLRVTKTGTATAHPGQTVTYTITVHNNGGSDATNVIVADATPTGLTFVANSGACSAAYPCNIGTLLNGGTATITSTYTVNAGFNGSVINTAIVSSDVPDPTPNNNSSSTPTAVTPGGGQTTKTPVPIDARWMLLAMIGLIAGVGLRRTRAKR
ncbi:MAG: hypothetical protein ABJB01_07300 [Rudaea sp.]